MKKYFLFFGLITLSVFLISCSDDDGPAAGKFKKGVFVVNEGNYQDADGSLSFIHDGGNLENAIFSTANSGRILGDVVQSMAITAGRAYISVNNSNVLEIVNSETMEWITSKEDVLFPRTVRIHDGSGFLTEWVSFSESGRLTEFDLETGATIRQVETGFGAEDLLVSGDRIYVSNSWSGNVSIIGLGTFEKIVDVPVGIDPGGLARDQAGNIWVICGGDFSVEGDGQLYRINKETSQVDLILDLMTDPLTRVATDDNGHFLYYVAGPRIFKLDLSLPGDGPNQFANIEDAVSLYGVGMDSDGMVYVSDSRGFQGNGSVSVLNADGELTGSFQVGRGPNGFVFVQ